MANSHYWTNASIATATAIFLSLPLVGSNLSKAAKDVAEYRPLDQDSSRLVANAVEPSRYVAGESMAMFTLISELALRLVKESKSLDSDFSQIVDKEFWNLLR